MRIAFITLLVSVLTCCGQFLQHRRGAFRPAAAAAACSTYNTTNAWDNFIEGFEIATTGYESNVSYSVWSETDAGNCVLSAAADSSALTKYKPNGACGQAFKIVFGDDGNDSYTRANLGASIDLDAGSGVDVWCSIYIETGLPTSGQNVAIIDCTASTSPGNNRIELNNATGQLQLRPVGVAAGNYINISAGQWYTLKITFDQARAAGGSSLTIFSNGSEVGTASTFQRLSATDLRYLWLGATSGFQAGETATIWYDLVLIKTN